jgi:hypothetical protein
MKTSSNPFVNLKDCVSSPTLNSESNNSGEFKIKADSPYKVWKEDQGNSVSKLSFAKSLGNSTIPSEVDGRSPSGVVKKGLKSLKSVIKIFNKKIVQDLESDYLDFNKKFDPNVLILAEIYISGKRVTSNFPRAIEILSISSLAEAKLMLMKLSIQLEKYSDAYYYKDLLSIAKCSCLVTAPKVKNYIFTNANKQFKSNSLLPESNISSVKPSIKGSTKCIMHECLKLENQVLQEVGPVMAVVYKKEGQNSRFQP